MGWSAQGVKRKVALHLLGVVRGVPHRDWGCSWRERERAAYAGERAEQCRKGLEENAVRD